MFEAHFFNRCTPGCARIVDQDIDSPEFRDCRIYHLLNTRRILHIAADGKGFYAERLQLIRGVFAAVLLAGAKHEIGAHFRQAFRHLSSQPN